ncbi:D-alanine--D-serine ligase VanG [Hominifimenecus sp. rT4P-3]|uniref:D-alanine--D-serine ligase VanG n=1 Tax=Hominifimenecus sp. rT4P-3 TaxID=3242979 RepID=UPI003DA5380D
MNLQNNTSLSKKIRKKIALFFGGCSSEYEVSLQSAYAILTSIDSAQYEVFPIGIAKDGRWFFFQGDFQRLLTDTWLDSSCCLPCFPSPDRTLHGLVYGAEYPLHSISLDAAFPVLHGKNGEDGTIQGVLELANIPIIGCGTLSSALCMDKAMAHQVASAAHVRVPDSVLVDSSWEEKELQAAATRLGYPLFVKPVRSGSSFGITKVYAKDRLISAVKYALNQDSQVLLEEAIDGFEVGCAVLGDNELTVGSVDEIELSEGFFDYTEKYSLATAKIHVPARIPDSQAHMIQETATKLYRAFGCRVFARIDFFLTPNGDLVFNEVNTIPGFTAHSRYPRMMEAAGIPFPKLIETILNMRLGHENH